jgi:transcription antitermination factor NusG
MGGSFGNVIAEDAFEARRGAQPPEPAVGDWFAIQIRYRWEKKVVEQLNHKGCVVYLPMRSENHVWSDREKVVTTPLFPGYAFVRVDRTSSARRNVVQTAGLLGFVTFGGMTIPVPATQIEHLQILLRDKALFSLHPFLNVGQRVRIRGGCLQGLEGVLLQLEGKLVISIEAIQRSLAVEIRGYELDLV